MDHRLHDRLHPLKRLFRTGVVACALLGLFPAAATAGFGFDEVDVVLTGPDGSPAMQAGAHPYALTTTLRVDTVVDSGLEGPDGNLRDLRIEYPPGLVAAPGAVPTCSTADFLQIEDGKAVCGNSSAVGIVEITASTSGPIPVGSGDFLHRVPLYSLTPSVGSVGRIGFVAAGIPVVLELGLDDTSPERGFAELPGLSQALLFYGARISVWGVPADSAHDPDRGQCVFSGTTCPSVASAVPFLTAPRSCNGPMATLFTAASWQDPGQQVFATALSHDNADSPHPLGLLGCGKLAFLPQVSIQPTTDRAETSSGLDLSIGIQDEGLTNPAGLAQSEIESVSLALPEGMAVNPALAEGIDACTPAQYAQESLDSEPEEGCPEDSEIGTIEVETPLLASEVLEGRVFAAQPDDPETAAPGVENPFDASLALYAVIEDPGLGVLVKRAGEVEVDSSTAQLVVSFDDLPQFPISHLELHLDEGELAPFLTPPECNEFAAKATLTPWSDPDSGFIATTSFEIVEGMGGDACPSDEGLPSPDPGLDPGPDQEIDDSDRLPLAGIPAPPGIVMPAASPNPGRKRPCPRGKRRVGRGKRCVARNCSSVRTERRSGRRCVRSRGRGTTRGYAQPAEIRG